MSIEKMTLVTLSGPKDMVDVAIGSCVLDQDFHPENTVQTLRGVKRLSTFDSPNPYSALLSKSCDLAAELGVTADYAPFEDKNYTPEVIEEYFDELSNRISDLNKQQKELIKTIQSGSAIESQLRHFKGLDEQVNDILAMKYLKARFGRTRKKNYDELHEMADTRDDVFLIDTGTENEWVYCVYFVLPRMEDQIDSVFATMGFERIRIPTDFELKGDAAEAATEIRQQIVKLSQKLKTVEEQLSEIKTAQAEELLSRYSYLKFMNECYEMRSYAGYVSDKFYIIGWIPTVTAEEYALKCEKIVGFSCIRTREQDVHQSKPPVKLKTNLLTRIFQPFIEMYGLPASDESDPSLFMAISYTLMFGIMFGDVGQGALLSLLGFVLWKKRKMWLGRILCIVGMSSVVFGFVYGSIFGYEHILPGFKVLEDGNTMTMLYISVAIGVVMLLICMVINMINGIRQHDVKKIFFSPNGLAGFIMYMSIAVAVVVQAVLGIKLFSTAYILGLVVLPLLLMMSAEPLTKLVTGEKNWLPKSMSSFFVEGFFELFETVLSFVSNTVSFLRIGAFVISHAGMMMVVFLLSSDGKSIFGVIIGNLLVMGIEATLVCIQVMRLEFYELFGRFYSGGGRAFVSKTVNYSMLEK